MGYAPTPEVDGASRVANVANEGARVRVRTGPDGLLYRQATGGGALVAVGHAVWLHAPVLPRHREVVRSGNAPLQERRRVPV
jgi:hypothetical protein